MHDLALSTEFRAFAEAPERIIDGALLVARVVNADTDIAWVRAELRRLAAATDAADAAGLLAFLRAQGFAGAQTYYSRENSSLEQVLRNRRGIPITLAVVVIGVAEALGLHARGVNFPSHFLVSVEGVLADPFAMRVIDAEQREVWLRDRGVSEHEAFPTATNIDIVLRMLNNLRALAMQRNDFAAALDLSAYQILMLDDPLAVRLERIDLWLAAGVPDMAAHEIDQALALTGDENVREELHRRRLAISAVPNRLH